MLFYHYCSYEKFISILSSKTLWLTPIVKSNDDEEVVRTLQIVWSKIRDDIATGIKDVPNSKEILDILDKQMKLDAYCSTTGHEIPYCTCLSTNRDLMQNWKEYGDSGKGISLGFSSELFAGIERNMPHPSSIFQHAIGWDYILYDDKDFSSLFVPLFVNVLKNDQTAMGWMTVRTTLKHYSAFIKNPSFIDEREVRIVYYPDSSHEFDGTTELTRNVGHSFPHCALPWVKSNGMVSLKEVIVGNNCEHSIGEVSEMLEKAGIDSIDISKSECSYRISENR